MARGWILICAVLLLGSAGHAAVLSVPGGYPTIKDAINASVNGDVIVVQSGIYTENINFDGKMITLRSESGPLSTIIDGGGSGSVVTFAGGEGRDAVLQGFTITGGTGTMFAVVGSTEVPCGGGIFCNTTEPTIAGNIIVGNDVGQNGYGGGIFLFTVPPPVPPANPLVEGNVITGNDAKMGGGVFTKYTDADLLANEISANEAGFGGGAIACWLDSAPLIANNVIVSNSCGSGGGGGIRAYNATTPMLVNNTFFGNTTPTGGGGGVKCQNCDVTIANSIFRNDGALEGPELWVGHTSTNSATLTIAHSDVEGGQASVHVVPGSGSTLEWKAGMITGDPLFVDAANGDFHLTWNSPCRDAGDGTVPGLPSGDFEGDPRIAGGIVDMGADEFHYHLYSSGVVAPGSPITIRVVGIPGLASLLALGSGIQDPPLGTQHGDLWLAGPPAGSWRTGPIPGKGVLDLTVTVPAAWLPGSVHPLQALVGVWGGARTRLTNMLALTVP